MTYMPRVISRTQKTLDLEELLQSRYWHKISFRDIKKNDRLLVVRISNGARILVESEVKTFEYTKGAWLNSLGTPVVSVMDSQIFRSGEAPADQSEDNPDEMLGS